MDRIVALKAAARRAAANAVAQTVVALALIHAAHPSQASLVALRVPDDLVAVHDDLLEVPAGLPHLSVVFQAPEPRLCLCP